MKISSFLLVLFFIAFSSCKKKKENYVEIKSSNKTVDWSKAHNFYSTNIETAIQLLDSLKKTGLHTKNIIPVFDELRIAFKKAEPYAGALNADITHRSNGPALPIYKEDNGKVLKPIGLQKLEETIYDEMSDKDTFERELSVLMGLFQNLKKGINKRELTAKRFFKATHQQLIRIPSLALAGFDTPTTGKSIRESTISLQALIEVYKLSIQNLILEKDKSLNDRFISSIDKAINYINNDSDFITFDRFTFIRDYFNPITRNWVQIRKTANIWEPDIRFSPFNYDAPTFFEEDSFNVNHFLGVNTKNPSKDLIALGEKLFFEKKLSKNGTMACVTCHNPKLAYTDGLKLSINNLGRPADRNTPTLLNSSFQKGFFWDGRSPNLESQIKTVFKNKSEFNTDVHKFSTKILSDSTYTKAFKKVFGKVPSRNKETIRAIAAYISTLTSFNSKFDKNIRGEEDTYTETEKNGFNLFMGKALCATCHFMPLTNGSVPPFFTETEKEVIGVPKNSDNKSLDDDKGFYIVYGEELHRGMFKTPTVRNAALTAPYMHNGVYNTLEEVMNFYNLGGGGGLGFEGLDHQTLPFDNLNLSEKEISELVAFIKTMSDNSSY